MNAQPKKMSLLVCERTVYWAAALRRMIPQFHVREVRSLAQCWAELVERPQQFVILEATQQNLNHSRLASGRPSGESLLERMRAISSRWPSQTAMAVVMRRELLPATWMLREAGAAYVATSVLELAPLQRIVDRHLDRIQSLPQPADEGLLDSKHLNLPW